MVSTRAILPRRPSRASPASLLARFPDRHSPLPSSRSAVPRTAGRRRLVYAALLVGLLVRLVALPYPGTGDVIIWKVWAYSGAVVGSQPDVRRGRRRPRSPRSITCCISASRGHRRLSAAGALRTGRRGARTRGRHEQSMGGLRGLHGVHQVDSRRVRGGALRAAFVACASARERAARWAVVVYWLNPAAIINASFGGYLDPLFVLPAVGALMAATTGWPVLAGGLIAASSSQAQGIFIVPAVMLALWNGAANPAPGRARIAAGAAGGISYPGGHRAVCGGGRVVEHGSRRLIRRRPEIFVSMDGYNFWWIAGHAMWVAYAWQRGLEAWAVFMAPVDRIPFVRALAHGLPDLRVAGAMLGLAASAGASGWADGRAIFRLSPRWPPSRCMPMSRSARRSTRTISSRPCHFVIAAATRRRFVPILAGVSAFLALSMIFYMFGAEESQRVLSRSLTLVDTTLLLAVFNCGCLCGACRCCAPRPAHDMKPRASRTSRRVERRRPGARASSGARHLRCGRRPRRVRRSYSRRSLPQAPGRHGSYAEDACRRRESFDERVERLVTRRTRVDCRLRGPSRLELWAAMTAPATYVAFDRVAAHGLPYLRAAARCSLWPASDGTLDRTSRV